MSTRVITLVTIGLPLVSASSMLVPIEPARVAATTRVANVPAPPTTVGAGAGECVNGRVSGTCVRAGVDTPDDSSESESGGGGGGGSGSPERTCHWEPAEDHGIGTEESNTWKPPNAPGPGNRLMVEVCSDGTLGITDWRTPGQANNPQPPPPDPEDVLPALTDQVEEMLPVPTLHTPADWFADGISYVQIPTVFWLDDGTWEAVQATASVPQGAPVLSVTVVAEPRRLVIDPGDNTELVVCQGDPPELPFGGDPEQYTGCSHTYRHSSSTAPNGETWPVTGQIVWHVTWTATNGQSGDLGEVTTTAEPMALPVGEVEGIITG